MSTCLKCSFSFVLEKSLPDPLCYFDLTWVSGLVTSEHSCLPRSAFLLVLEFAWLLFCDESPGSWMSLLFLLPFCFAVLYLLVVPWEGEPGMKKTFETLYMTCFFALKFHDNVSWRPSVFIHIHWRNMWLPVWKLTPSVLGNFLEFFLSFFSTIFFSLELFLSRCWACWIGPLIFCLIIWHYFLVGLLNYPSVEFFIYAVIFLGFLFSLNFQNHFLFLFHGYNIY